MGSASAFQHPTFNFEHPTFNFEHPTSKESIAFGGLPLTGNERAKRLGFVSLVG
jgi:hypothetical protein